MSNRILAWTDEAWDSYVYCGATPRYAKRYPLGRRKAQGNAHRCQGQDKKTLKRINKLIKATKSSPFQGIGKPEPLKENLSGFWSRRIDDTNRLVYAVDDNYLTIISCRYHY
ncbi:MAG: Txe/YoeB family addiction module toxin [Cyanobacteria bacterium J06621_8]